MGLLEAQSRLPTLKGCQNVRIGSGVQILRTATKWPVPRLCFFLWGMPRLCIKLHRLNSCARGLVLVRCGLSSDCRCRIGRLQDATAVIQHFNDFSQRTFDAVNLDLTHAAHKILALKADLEHIYKKTRYCLISHAVLDRAFLAAFAGGRGARDKENQVCRK